MYNKIVKKTPNHKEYCTQDMRESQLSLPINIEKKIANDDEVFTLEEICEELDFSTLKRKCRNSIYDPVIMFKIIVYGYMCHIYSSRAIEKACR